LLSGFVGTAGLAAIGWLGYQVLSLQLPVHARESTARAAPELALCRMPTNGYLRGRLHGTADLDIDWSGAALACSGNARPGDAGVRLFFAGHPAGSEDRLVLVIGIGADVAQLAGRELPASVTLIDEASSQFFHSGDDRCLTRISAVEPLPDERYSYRVAGDLYCAGAVPAVAGGGTVTLGDLAFAGRLVLDPQ
jgi:hypothetical protein